MSDANALRVRYNVDDARMYLAIAGSACHRTSLVGEHLATEFLAKNPAAPEFILDLDASRFLDSTFAGWMIRLFQRLKAVGGRLVVSRCPDRCRADLQVMGLTSLFDFEDVTAPATARELSNSEIEDLDPSTLAHMLQAHEDLTQINEENRRVFTPITDALRNEMKKRES